MTVAAKICGITSLDAIDAALDGGADYVGFVFFPKSPRNIDVEEARSIAERARGKAKIVALTVDADDSQLDEIASSLKPDFMQLHGRETPERAAAVATRLEIPVIKAIGVASQADVQRAEDYTAAELVLFDAKPIPGSHRPGGNGVPFDWQLLAEASGRRSFMLSGGLTADNVANAIELTHPSAVDVSSGVESAPGVKDPELIRRFLRAVKTAK